MILTCFPSDFNPSEVIIDYNVTRIGNTGDYVVVFFDCKSHVTLEIGEKFRGLGSAVCYAEETLKKLDVINDDPDSKQKII